MIVEHLGLVVSYLLWSYILICIFIKLTFYNKKGRKKIIIRFLDNKSYMKNITMRRVRRYVRDEELFDFLCYGYCKKRSRYSNKEKRWFDKFMKEILCEKIKLSKKRDTLYKYFLFVRINKCRIHSSEIDAFVKYMNL